MVGRFYNLLPEMAVFNRFADLRSAFVQDRLDAATLSVEELMMLGVSSKTIFLPAMAEGIDVRYAIIVHGAGDVQAPKSLVGRKIALHESSRMVLALPWLETLMAETAVGGQEPIAVTSVFKPIHVENPSKAIFQVYFRQVDAALVTQYAFDLACELNPQLHRDLDVLAISPPFIPSVLMFRPTYQGPHREQIEAAINELHTTAGGRQLLTTFQCSDMERHPSSVLDATKAFLLRYKQLRQKPAAKALQP